MSAHIGGGPAGPTRPSAALLRARAAREAVEALTRDPLIRQLATELGAAMRHDPVPFRDEHGGPSTGLVVAAAHEYRVRGGLLDAGAPVATVALALLELIDGGA